MKKLFYLLAPLVVLTLVFLANVSPTYAASRLWHNISLPHTYAASASCQINGKYPDASCTPGNVFSHVTAKQVCTPGYARKVRHVPQSVKDKVYADYGITNHFPGQYEIDHFVALELGGSNEVANLWPEPANPTPGFHEKDKVENYLHAQVCSGKRSLSDAQRAIVSDWVAVYKQIP